MELELKAKEKSSKSKSSKFCLLTMRKDSNLHFSKLKCNYTKKAPVQSAFFIV
jgi:hypothetical protein